MFFYFKLSTQFIRELFLTSPNQNDISLLGCTNRIHVQCNPVLIPGIPTIQDSALQDRTHPGFCSTRYNPSLILIPRYMSRSNIHASKIVLQFPIVFQLPAPQLKMNYVHYGDTQIESYLHKQELLLDSNYWQMTRVDLSWRCFEFCTKLCLGFGNIVLPS